jgi:hypothetical protein
VALHKNLADHDADPPSAWQVNKVADRAWHLDSSLGHTLGTYPTRKAAEADKETGPLVALWENEGRWMRGEPVAGWRPYAEVQAESERIAARRLSRATGPAPAARFPDEAAPGAAQGGSRRFEVTRVPEREGYDRLHDSPGPPPDPFLLLIDGRAAGGTYWCPYNPAPSGFGRDDGGQSGRSWASWGPRGLSCGHPTREAAEQAQVDVYKTDPDGWDTRLAGEGAELTPERDRADGARFWDHRTHRDFWAGYRATLARVRAERPSTVDGLAAILNRFQAPSAGLAFFGNNADDRLCDALVGAGWDLRFIERDYLWEARHPGSGERLHYAEGDVYPGPYKTASSSEPSAPARSVLAEQPVDYPDPVPPGAPPPVAARPLPVHTASQPAARRVP